MSMQTAFRRAHDDSEEDTYRQIVDWILHFVVTSKRARNITPKAQHRFDEFGLDSIATVKLAVELSEWLSLDVDPVLAFEYPTVEKLARNLARQIHERG